MALTACVSGLCPACANKNPSTGGLMNSCCGYAPLAWWRFAKRERRMEKPSGRVLPEVNCGADRRVTKACAGSGWQTSNCLPYLLNGGAVLLFPRSFPSSWQSKACVWLLQARLVVGRPRQERFQPEQPRKAEGDARQRADLPFRHAFPSVVERHGWRCLSLGQFGSGVVGSHGGSRY